jgi:hypothetical protein
MPLKMETLFFYNLLYDEAFGVLQLKPAKDFKIVCGGKKRKNLGIQHSH